jgi:hypothetical protein
MIVELQDYGIYLEIIGFIILLLVTGRNPEGKYMVMEGHKELGFDKFRSKVIPDCCLPIFLVFGISAIIVGLLFQLNFFN